MRAPGKNAPPHKHAEFFVRWHLGRDCFAPFTGCDYPAWKAFVYLVERWCAGMDQVAVDAMRATVLCAQQRLDILQCFVQAIPAVGDWPHVAKLWPHVVGTHTAMDRSGKIIDPRRMYAVERGDDRTWYHGLGAPPTATLHVVP